MKQRKQRRDKIARLISWGHWFTFFNILLVLAIGTLYIEATEAPGSALGVLYLIMNWLGHFAFLPFIVFIILIFPFCLLIPYTRILRGIATLVASFGLIALVADALFYRQYGYHLNTYSLSQLATDAETAFAGASFLILLGMLLIFVVLLIFELGLANIAWKRLDQLQQKHWGNAFSAVFVLCFLASHSIHIWADAVFYTPITKQDDMFPLSYPTTAKTLMSKHGLLVEQRLEATENLIRQGTAVNLAYPSRALQCARVPEAPNTLVIALNQLDTTTVTALLHEFPELTQYESPVLGHRNSTSGLFELMYALPDLYQAPIEHANKQPVYFSTLRDYRVEVALQNQLQTSSLPGALNEFTAFNLPEPSAFIGLATADTMTTEMKRILRRQIDQQTQVVVVGIQPQQPAGKEALSITAMQVPLLYTVGISLKPQPLVLLTDIMPTILARYINCVDEADAYSIGIDLSAEQRRLPVMTSFGHDLVVYDEEMTSIIQADASIRTFDNQEQKLLPGVSPATPVLVDGIRRLKRFSQEQQSTVVD
ncbi:DUF3413 domain-containing protein [Pseudidiomarina marina]|uniref:Alkaline phosphatase n=1 Tax=Pseudidiomarina marina TaxID=502366 RepID=A0A432YJL4_9GAMM|nr:DUF3413 domain-containing protein [Pseudidiomarina marina]RUO61144.1 alkaline phosphatase [Pseudidiomarina marina]